jgi:uncharacterized protein (TIGR03437 family)
MNLIIKRVLGGLFLLNLYGVCCAIAAPPAQANSTLSTLAISRPSIATGIDNSLIMTSEIGDSSVIPGSVQLQRLDANGRVVQILGALHDDGNDGDARANDHIWTIRASLREEVPGAAVFRVSAALKGSLTRSYSPTASVTVTGRPTGFAAARLARPLSLSGVLHPAAQAGTTILDYEGFQDSAALVSQYPGLTFSHAAILQSGVSLNEFEFPPHSGTNVVSDSGGAMTVAFSVPVASFSGFFTYKVPVTLTAYDANNVVLGSATSHFTNNQALSGAPGTSANDNIQVSSASGISKVIITGAAGGASFTMDDSVLGAPVTVAPPVVPPVPAGPPPLSFSGNTFLGTIALGGSISGSLTATGGVPPYKFSSLGPLPGGLALTSDGRISGKPTQPGANSFTATVTDSQPSTTSITVSFSVLAITVGSLPDATAFVTYSQTLSATGGSAPYQFSATGLPPGLSVSGGGAISGIPTRQGKYAIAIQVTDANGVSGTASVNLNVAAPLPLVVPAVTLTSGAVSTRYSQAIAATGGAPPYTWSVASGALPDGLSLSTFGVVSGLPSARGAFVFSATATDSTGGSATGQISITIAPPALVISSASPLPSGMTNQDYPVQYVTAAGGVAPYTFVLSSGALPAGLTLSGSGAISGTPTSTGIFTLTVKGSDSNGSTGLATTQMTIRAAATDLLLSSGSVVFSLSAGSSSAPAAQQIQVRSSVPATSIPFSAAISPAVPWLSVTSAGSSTPGVVTVSLTGQALALAAASTPYQASIVFTCGAGFSCASTPQSVTVSLTVSAAAPQLSVLTSLLAFSIPSAAPQPSSQSLTLQNPGGGSLGIASITSGAGWALLGSFPATIPGGPLTSVNITADPTGLAPGFYRTTINISTSGGKAVIPVTLLLAGNGTMALSPAAQQVLMSAGGVPPATTNSFPVSVTAASSVAWTASVLPGAAWLTTATASGASTSGAPGNVAFSIDPGITAGLAPATYYGTIRVASAQVVNSPQDFQVVLTVAPGSSPQIPNPNPQGLLFIAAPSSSVPPQTVQVSSGGAASVNYQATASTSDGHAWLAVSPATGSATGALPAQTEVAVNTTGLSAGVYYGAVSYAGGGAAVRTVNVTLVVTTAAAGKPDARTQISATPAACTPAQQAVARIEPTSGFSATLGVPTPISLRVVNDCGAAVTTSQIAAGFSNGDAPLVLQLANPTTGLYSATWTPRHTAGQVSINATATTAGLPVATTAFIGTVSTSSAPLLFPQATLHVFNPQLAASLAPGTIVQIYGSNFASQISQASTIPLPLNLAGTSVTIGGIPAPLYYVSPGQINAQVPFELSANHQYQVVINSNGTLSTPDVTQLADLAPGLAAFASGSIIAIHSDGTLVSGTAPAKPGEYLVVFAAGLGATDNPVASGIASPGAPLATALATPAVTINSEAASVVFAGMTPTLVGLYQINFQVPTDAPNGDLTLAVSQNGVDANATTLTVHN